MRSVRRPDGTGKAGNGNPRRAIGAALSGKQWGGTRDLDVGEVDAGGRETAWIALTDAGGGEACDLDPDRLRRRFERDIGDAEGAAERVERDLAVARLAAARPQLLERRLNLRDDPVLRVELDAEIAARGHHDGSEQADQDLYHSGNSV